MMATIKSFVERIVDNSYDKVWSKEELNSFTCTLSSLYSKKELKEAIGFCVKMLDNAFNFAEEQGYGFDYENNQYFFVTNVVLSCLGLETLEECNDVDGYIYNLLNEYKFPEHWY